MEPSTFTERGSSSKSNSEQEQTGMQKWNSKHKIFLSHSGKEKDFVRQLCKDLEVETHEPFFDERSSSLMMGERFAPLIFEAARHCLVAMVVLSEDFLTSKWPMLELVEFVKAKKSHNYKLKLFPLFYKLSPNDLKVESIESRWSIAWSKIVTTMPNHGMALDDTQCQLSLSLCVEALCELRASNGLKFQNFASEVEYRAAIVKEISLLVAPNLLDDTSDVVGNKRLCKVLGGMFIEDTVKDSNLKGTCKLGLYGMGGLGKTTMSRALCMFYYKDFNGRVFHVELGSQPPLDLQKLVLTKLLRINKDIVERVHTVHEGRKLLKDHMNRQRVFLVIDNINSHLESRMEALAYLMAGFHVGSMIMITSRSFDVIEELFPSHPNALYCKGVASLCEEEARLIFLQRAAPNTKLETLSVEEQEILKVCVDQCHFLFENKKRQYHPLALQALADYYHKHNNSNVWVWKEHLGDLDKLRLSNASSDIFGILGLQFRALTSKEKLLFLDLCLYGYQGFSLNSSRQDFKWFVDIHEETPTIMKFQLQSLKRSGIINVSLNEDGNKYITIHDLYIEFAKWYVIDGEGSHTCVFHTTPTNNSLPEETKLGSVNHKVSTDSLPYVLKKTSPTPSQLQRIRLENLKCATFPSHKVQEWCNLVVLQIHKCSNLKVLNLHGLSCLRHLELISLPELESFDFAKWKPYRQKSPSVTLESLQHIELGYLTSLKRLPDFSTCPSLKRFKMLACAEFLPLPPRFRGCLQLEYLSMEWNLQWPVEEFQLNTLISLISLVLWKGRFNPFMTPSGCSRICAVRGTPRFLKLWRDVKFAGLGACSQLQILYVLALPITSLLGVEKLTKLRELSVFDCKFLRDIPDLSALTQMENLRLSDVKISKLQGLERLLQLRSMHCLGCKELTSFPDLDHLPKLTKVEFEGCDLLKVKPRLPQGCVLTYDPGAFVLTNITHLLILKRRGTRSASNE